MIIKMIVHSVTTLVTSHMLSWNRTQVSVIIITKHKGYTIQLRIIHQTFCVLITIKIWFNFLVEGKHTRYLIQVSINIFADKTVLSFNYISKKINIVGKGGILHNCSVGFTAHSYGNHIFKLTVAL